MLFHDIIYHLVLPSCIFHCSAAAAAVRSVCRHNKLFAYLSIAIIDIDMTMQNANIVLDSWWYCARKKNGISSPRKLTCTAKLICIHAHCKNVHIHVICVHWILFFIFYHRWKAFKWFSRLRWKSVIRIILKFDTQSFYIDSVVAETERVKREPTRYMPLLLLDSNDDDGNDFQHYKITSSKWIESEKRKFVFGMQSRYRMVKLLLLCVCVYML